MAETQPTSPSRAYRGSEPYIFVSYSHADSKLVLPEISRLQMDGYRIWYDEGIDPGTIWKTEIARALTGSTLFLIFISPRAVVSEFVVQEFLLAREKKKKFIAVHLEETELTEHFMMDMAGTQALLRYKDVRQYWSTLSGVLPRSLQARLEPENFQMRREVVIPTGPNVRARKHLPVVRANAFKWTLGALALGLLIAAAGFRSTVIALADRIAAEAGSAQYMTSIGGRYLNGNGVAKDDAEALSWFRKAAEAGDAEGAMDSGSMYLNGWGVKEDDAQAGIWYRRAAEAGNATAMTRLGALYEEGRGMAKNDFAAMSWYRKAAQTGDAEAIVRIGVMYEYGLGVTRDDAGAVNWYRRAAKAGDVHGMTNLGDMFRYGQGVPQDFAQAMSWYRKAAEAGDERAMACLGTMYLYGLGVAKDEAQAVNWLRRTNDPVSHRGLAILKRRQKEPSEDGAHRADRLRKAAEAGNPADMAMLGDIYEYGLASLPINEIQAAKWYRKAAEAGDEVGMLSLGAMYEHGLGGLAKDINLARLWSEKAAGLGSR